MLENLRGIPDRRLRSYIGGRLLSGLSLRSRSGREGRKKPIIGYRDITIAGRLISPLLDRFIATRSGGTREKGTAELACSIVSKALARMGHSGYDGINISEKTVEDVWRAYAPFWCDHDLTSSRSIPN